MTDDEALYQLNGWLSLDEGEGCGTCIDIPALRHAVQAIEDRAKLVDVCLTSDDPQPVVAVLAAARRHMRGETPAEPDCSDCTPGRDGDCAICKPPATPQEKP